MTEKKNSGKGVKVYNPAESYAVGDQIYHKVWDKTGTVTEVGTTEDGVGKIVVDFGEGEKKRLVTNYKIE